MFLFPRACLIVCAMLKITFWNDDDDDESQETHLVVDEFKVSINQQPPLMLLRYLHQHTANRLVNSLIHLFQFVGN